MACGKEVANVSRRQIDFIDLCLGQELEFLGDEMKIDLSCLDWKNAYKLLISAILQRPIAFVPACHSRIFNY